MSVRVVALLVMTALAIPAQDRNARIYVYARRNSPANRWIAISSNSGVLAEIREGRYFVMQAPAGGYRLTPADGTPMTFEAQPGAKSYVRLDWDYVMGRPPVPLFSIVPEGPARQEMRYLRYIDAKHVRSPSVLKSDPDPPFDRRFQTR